MKILFVRSTAKNRHQTGHALYAQCSEMTMFAHQNVYACPWLLMAAYFPNNGLYHYVIVRDEIIDRFTNYLDNVDMELKWRY